MERGSAVVLKEEYNVQMSYGNVGFMIGSGTKGIILKYENGICMVGFKLNETVTVTALINEGALEELNHDIF